MNVPEDKVVLRVGVGIMDAPVGFEIKMSVDSQPTVLLGQIIVMLTHGLIMKSQFKFPVEEKLQ
ncbi:MAG: hypothetical protein R2874_00655 [Desulfobacterales bacterium]